MSISQDPLIEPTIVCTSELDAIEVISGAVKALEQARIFFTSRPDWYSKTYRANERIPLSHNTVQSKEDAEAAQRGMRILDVLRPAQEAFDAICDWVSAHITACEAHVTSMKLRAGLSLIPDEVLENILKFASQQDNLLPEATVQKSVNAAITLSQVCSRFRAVINSTFDLWNRISPSMRREAIAICFARCGVHGVVIDIASFRWLGDLFVFSQNISNDAHHWKGFELNCSDCLGYMFPSLVNNLRNFRFGTSNTIASSLNRIKISYPDITLKDEHRSGNINESLHFYSTWSSPLLENMDMKNLIPIPFAGSSSLAFLSIDLNFRHRKHAPCTFDIAALTTFLSSCPNLTDLSMTIKHCKEFTAPSSTSPKVEMSSLERAGFKFIYCNYRVAKAFFDIVAFPYCGVVRLTCDSRERKPESEVQCQKILDVVLSSPEKFPRLQHLELEIRAEGWYIAQSRSFAPNTPISIPFWNTPHLRTLVLVTWATLLELPPKHIILKKLTKKVVENCWEMQLEWYSEFFVRSCDVHFDKGRHGFASEPLLFEYSGTPWEDVVEHVARRNGTTVEAPTKSIGGSDHSGYCLLFRRGRGCRREGEGNPAKGRAGFARRWGTKTLKEQSLPL